MHATFIFCQSEMLIISFVFDLRLAEFEKQLSERLVSSVDFISAIAEDLVTAGGKRLRPKLAFLTADLLSVKDTDALNVAVAVELLHSASLLHDDLIDDSETRRGREAAFKRYGNIVSVMSGDFMLAKVLGVLAETNNPAFTTLMSDSASQICEGEVLQFQAASLETHSLETYYTIIEGKTAALFAAAIEGVAILAGVETKKRQALSDFAWSYGRAFQMRDDYLDLLGDEETLGKPIGGDLKEGKATFAVLKLFDFSSEARDIVMRHAANDDDINRMLELIKEYKTDDLARAQISLEVEKAISALDIFPDSIAKSQLQKLAHDELERVK